jgi:hypothetical protein
LHPWMPIEYNRAVYRVVTLTFKVVDGYAWPSSAATVQTSLPATSTATSEPARPNPHATRYEQGRRENKRGFSNEVDESILGIDDCGKQIQLHRRRLGPELRG